MVHIDQEQTKIVVDLNQTPTQRFDPFVMHAPGLCRPYSRPLRGVYEPDLSKFK